MTDRPSGKDLSNPPGVIGQELVLDNPRQGHIDDGNIAFAERLVEARRQWPQARPEDFDKIGKRSWRDKATGIEYREVGDAHRALLRFAVAFTVKTDHERRTHRRGAPNDRTAGGSCGGIRRDATATALVSCSRCRYGVAGSKPCRSCLVNASLSAVPSSAGRSVRPCSCSAGQQPCGSSSPPLVSGCSSRRCTAAGVSGSSYHRR